MQLTYSRHVLCNIYFSSIVRTNAEVLSDSIIPALRLNTYDTLKSVGNRERNGSEMSDRDRHKTRQITTDR